MAVVGAGTLGLTLVAALHHVVRTTPPCTVLVGASTRPSAAWPSRSAPTPWSHPPAGTGRRRQQAGSLVLAGRLTGGADVVFDCVASATRSPRPSPWSAPAGGWWWWACRPVSLHLAPLWHRELTLVGAYAYGVEPPTGAPTARRRTFEVALDLVARAGLGSLVSATYPLERYEEAVAHAGAARRRGAVKVAFDLRNRKGRTR